MLQTREVLILGKMRHQGFYQMLKVIPSNQFEGLVDEFLVESLFTAADMLDEHVDKGLTVLVGSLRHNLVNDFIL